MFKFGEDELEVCSVGATIISWKTAGNERLFLSKHAVFHEGCAIRGGIPLVFPQFGKGPITSGQHGFARNLNWSFIRSEASAGSLKITWELRANEKSREVWPFEFVLHYQVSMRPGELECELFVKNVDTRPFLFTALLHSYFLVSSGLENLKIRNLPLKANESFLIAGEVDRVFGDIQYPLLLDQQESKILIESNFRDVVIWNPWVEKSKTLSNFDASDYKRMICVEPGDVSAAIQLSPDECWSRYQRIKILDA